jgi:hypothetical protein
MRSFFGSIASLLLVMLVIGCNTVDPSECWPNTSGGFGGGGTLPLAAGVGATTSGGDRISPPPKGPLDESGTPNPCVTPESPKDPCAGVSAPAGDGAISLSCSDACRSKCPPPGGKKFIDFPLSNFPFVTTIQDDGTGPGGGYQEARANLEFKHYELPTTFIKWYCALTIGMPLRNEAMGKISADRAASLSKEITEGVADRMDYTLPQGIFCEYFIRDVRAAFMSKYPLLGAGVKK